MRKTYLAIIFAITFASACTFNVGTGTNNSATPVSNTTVANTTNSAPTTAENKSGNTANTTNTAAAPIAEKPQAAATNPPKRFKFAKGQDRADVTGTLNGQESQDYLIDLIGGQSLIIGGEDDSTELTVTDPKGKEVGSNAGNCGESVVVDDTVAGDYKLRIKPCKGKQSIKYKVQIAAGSGKEF